MLIYYAGNCEFELSDGMNEEDLRCVRSGYEVDNFKMGDDIPPLLYLNVILGKVNLL